MLHNDPNCLESNAMPGSHFIGKGNNPAIQLPINLIQQITIIINLRQSTMMSQWGEFFPTTCRRQTVESLTHIMKHWRLASRNEAETLNAFLTDSQNFECNADVALLRQTAEILPKSRYTLQTGVQNCHHFHERQRLLYAFKKCSLWCNAILRSGLKINIFKVIFW